MWKVPLCSDRKIFRQVTTWLELEITETAILHDTEETLAALHRIKGLGVAIAMDDFGTGFSSLSHLRRFPFDRVKIDQNFVRGLGECESDCAGHCACGHHPMRRIGALP